jgi:ubiquinone/menaquinone biosynthesis C-methylase UbiE
MAKKHMILSITLFTYSLAFSQHKHHGRNDTHDSTISVNEYMHQSSTDDLINHFESPERDAYQQPAKVLDYLGNLKNKCVIDIGAGSGYFSVKLANRGAKVIAADVNEKFQQALKKRMEDHNIKNIELRKIPYDSPNLAINEVDIALIVNTYHHIQDRSEYFSIVKKGTKPNGELVIIDFFKTEVPVGPPPNHKLSIDVVIAELKEAGYTDFEVNVSLLPYQYIIKAK